MKTLSVLLILTCSVLAWGQLKPPGTMAPAVHTDSGTTPVTNTTTTPAPNTTTTTTPNTTTTTTTTTTPNTTTTTTKASTTSVAPPTTKPPTKNNDTVGNYTMDNGKQRCLMVQMELKIRLVSQKANGSFLLLPNRTSTAGTCDESSANLTLTFPEGFVTFLFSKNMTQDSTFVNCLSFQLNYTFTNKGLTEYVVRNNSIHLFNAKIGHSYSCTKESLYMGNGLYLDLDKDRMQAFNFTKSNEFGTSDSCQTDNDYSKRVAIAVGVTLLVLVVVVVIVYLLMRKKRTDGYQSL